MFPLGILGALALAGFAGYQYAKSKNSNKNNDIVKQVEQTNTDSNNDKVKNIYNYYTTEAENGNTLFDNQQKTKRTLFGQ